MSTDVPKPPLNPLLAARQQVEQAEYLRQTRKFEEAVKHCRSALSRFPDYSAALFTLGLIYADLQQFQDALTNLVQASMLNPNDNSVTIALAGVYLRLGASVMAKRTLENARANNPNDTNILITLGEIYRQEREYELGAAAFRRALQIDGTILEAEAGLGQCCTHLGRTKEAIAAFERNLTGGGRSISVLFSLTQLPTKSRATQHLKLLDEAVPDLGQSERDFETTRVFARATILDRLGKHRQSWDDLVQANEGVLSTIPAILDRELRLQSQILAGTKNHPVVTKQKINPEDKITDTLFILGPTRSGKTTLENLIAGFVGVKRGFENPSVEQAVRQSFLEAALPPRDRIVELPPQLDGLFRKYYAGEMATRADGHTLFINTHPGLIGSVLRLANVLPNARFVFVKRNIDDIVYRIFLQKYKEGNVYAYEVKTITNFIHWYYEMIDVLAERLPLVSSVVHFENMIEDPESVVKNVAQLCSLNRGEKPLPVPGDDRGCATPYLDWMRISDN